MKNSLFLNAVWVVILCIFLGVSTAAFGETGRDMVGQALDLVHQALPSGADSLGDDKRKELLVQALKLLNNEPTNFHGHVGRAMGAIRTALRKIKAGDPYGTATEDIRRADSELRDAMSIAT